MHLNVPRIDGFSPAQLLFGRKQFTSVPADKSHYKLYDPGSAQAERDKAFHTVSRYHDGHKTFFYKKDVLFYEVSNL